MTPTIITLVEAAGDLAAEIGLQAVVAEPGSDFPAEATVHLRRAVEELQQVREALEMAIA